MPDNKTFRTGWFFWFKRALMLLSFYFIYFHIRQEDFLQYLLLLHDDFLENRTTRIYILFVVMLMFLNWYIESVKWRTLTAVFYRHTIIAAIRAVLSGLAISILTPNRSGDFAGRIMHLPPDKRVEGTVFSVVGSLALLLITINTGFLSLLYLNDKFLIIPVKYLETTIVGIVILLIISHYVFFFMRKYWSRLSKFKALEKYSVIINDTTKLSPSFLLKIYGLTLFRYAVFSLQFYILLIAFHIYLPFNISISLVMISFLFITTVPSFAISEIGIRGSICIYFFSKFTDDVTGVLMASTALWLINIATPAVAGAISVLYFKRGK